jgi:hypothetical protein
MDRCSRILRIPLCDVSPADSLTSRHVRNCSFPWIILFKSSSSRNLMARSPP